jgi:hypothetical protein
MNPEEFVASIVLVKQDLALPTTASHAAELTVADIACHDDKLGRAPDGMRRMHQAHKRQRGAGEVRSETFAR